MVLCLAAVQSEDRTLRKLKAAGKCPEGMTYIIVGAAITRHDDTPAAKIQSEKN